MIYGHSQQLLIPNNHVEGLVVKGIDIRKTDVTGQFWQRGQCFLSLEQSLR